MPQPIAGRAASAAGRQQQPVDRDAARAIGERRARRWPATSRRPGASSPRRQLSRAATRSATRIGGKHAARRRTGRANASLALGGNQRRAGDETGSISGTTGTNRPRSSISRTVGAGRRGRAASAIRRRSARATRPSGRWRGRCRPRSLRVGLAAAEARMKAEEAQDAQMVLGDALSGSPMKRTRARLQVVEPAEIVVELAGGGIGVERVDREIAPAGILRQSSVKATVARRPSVETSRRR